MMNRNDFLTMREQLMENIDCIVDGELDGIVGDALKDEIVRRMCDMVCDIMDPAGLE